MTGQKWEAGSAITKQNSGKDFQICRILKQMRQDNKKMRQNKI